MASRVVPRTVTYFGLLALAIPVVALFWFIHRYAVNMIFADQWQDIDIIGRANAGTLSLAHLWAQHGENRILVPNLIVLLLAHTVHFNVVFEEYLSGFFLVVATGLLICAHKRRSPSTPWLYYLPAAIVLLSLNQGGMTLFGFAMSWYLVICVLAIALFLLDHPTLRWPMLAGAILAAVAGSFSSLEGLLIWPIGLLLLHHRRRDKRVILAWIASAIATTCVYLYNLNLAATGTNRSYVIDHPIFAIRYFFFAIGNMFGAPIPNTPRASDYVYLVLGVIIFGIACWVLIVGVPRSSESTGSTIGVALVLFGLLYTIGLTEARASYGLSGLRRYAIFELLILAGCYLSMLDGTLLAATNRRFIVVGRRFSAPRLTSPPLPRSKWSPADAFRTGDFDHFGIRLVLVVVCLQAIIGTQEAVSSASAWHSRENAIADITVNIHKAPDTLVQGQLGSEFQSVSFIRRMAQIANTDHLSLFATSAVAQYTNQGLTVERTPPITSVLVPSNDAIVKGVQPLVAAASEPYGVTRVTFFLTGGAMHNVPMGRAILSPYGWVALWNTSSVGNGRYTIRSIAYSAAGNSSRSAAITITVRN